MSRRKATPFASEFRSPPPPPPPLSSLTGTASAEADATGYMNDWRRFKEAGFLDQSAMAKKDQNALAEKVSQLETELFDYQYNMGLLLVEKEDWTSKYEELRKALDETHEILKREKTANLIAYTEAENREANLRNILVSEKQCVAELESTLREINAERSKLKLSSDSALAEASSMIIGTEEKSLELERNSRAAEAKLAEANRKIATLAIRLKEVEARESLLGKEQHTLSAEREAYKARFERQREDLREWEQKLHEREDKLCKGRRTLVEREEKVNESENSFSQKEMKLQALQKQNDSSILHLNQKKEDVNKRLEDLISKEKEADSLRMSLEKKRAELELLEEKLSAREKIEVKQLLDEHRAVLDIKMRDFDLELEEKRRKNEKELSSKADSVRKKEAEINHRDEMLAKRDHAVHERSERLKEKNKETEDRLRTLKDKEKVLKAEERKLEEEKKQLAADKESLQDMLSKVEDIKAENVELERKISKEKETLIITEKERSDHLQLQLQLKQDIEKYQHQNELLSNEATELRLEKESFEKQWEDLDEKKSNISIESKELSDEKEKLEKFRKSEEGRLKEEKRSAEEFVKRELENLKLEKDSFFDTMKMERAALAEKAQSEHSQLVQDFESRRENLETECANQREKTEKLLDERWRAFEDEREKELENIKRLKEASNKEMEEVKAERLRIESTREEVSLSKEKQKADRLEMQSDIENLVSLNAKIKEQREELARERATFLAFVEKLKTCNDGEEVSRELTVSGFDSHRSAHGEASLDMSNPSLNSSKISWLKKCTTKILKTSPGKTSDHEFPPKADENSKEPVVLGSEGPRISENRSLSVLRKCEKSVEGPEESMQSESKNGHGRLRRQRKTGLNRTRSVREAIEEAEAFLGDDSLLPSESRDVSESLGDSVRVGKGKSAKKRQRSQASLVSESDSEACSVPGGRRYNLRSRTPAKTVNLEAESKRRKKESGGNPEVVSSSVGARKSGETAQLVHVAQTARTLEFSENKVVRFVTPDQDTRSKQVSAEITELSIEADKSNDDDDLAEEDESGSTIHESDDEYDDDDDEVKPGEASVGKKIWKFLTT